MFALCASAFWTGHAYAFDIPEFGLSFETPRELSVERINNGDTVIFSMRQLNEYSDGISLIVHTTGTGAEVISSDQAFEEAAWVASLGNERSIIRRKKANVAGLNAATTIFDFPIKKPRSRAEITVFVRNNVSYAFVYKYQKRAFNRYQPIFHTLLNSVSLQDSDNVPTEKTYDVTPVHFQYPGTWPTPRMVSNPNPGPEMINQEGAVWTLYIAPACDSCISEYRFPMVLRKFDFQDFPLDTLMKKDRTEIITDEVKDDVRVIRAQRSSEPNRDIRYFITSDAIYRLLSDPNGIEEPEGQKLVLSTIKIAQ